MSRDRGEEYAAAARLGAPQATQCADRFHLAQNLTKVVEEILASCRSELRKALKTETSTLPQWPLQDFSAKDAIWLFVRAPSDLEDTEKQELALICQASPIANMVYELVQEFMTMLRHRKGERLDDWLRSARDSHIREQEPLRRQH